MNEPPGNLPPLKWLRSFETSARLGSYTAAARELNITQSAVSQQIKLLEAHLQEALFFREGRKMRLTDAGLDYVYFVREAFDLIRMGTRSVFDKDRGRSLSLRFNMAFTLFWLMPRLEELYARHPWINLNILPHVWDQDVRPAKFSIEVRIGINLAEQGYRPLGDEYFFPVCSPGLLASPQFDAAPHFDSPGMTANWDRWHQSGHAHRPQKPVNYTSTVVVSLTAASNGVGLALSHSSLFGMAEKTGLLVRPFEGQVKMRERYFLSEVSEKEQTPATRAFLDWMGEQF